MLTLFTIPACPACSRTKRRLDELGVPYACRTLNSLDARAVALDELIFPDGTDGIPAELRTSFPKATLEDDGETFVFVSSDDIIGYAETIA